MGAPKTPTATPSPPPAPSVVQRIEDPWGVLESRLQEATQPYDSINSDARLELLDWLAEFFAKIDHAQIPEMTQHIREWLAQYEAMLPPLRITERWLKAYQAEHTLFELVTPFPDPMLLFSTALLLIMFQPQTDLLWLARHHPDLLADTCQLLEFAYIESKGVSLATLKLLPYLAPREIHFTNYLIFGSDDALAIFNALDLGRLERLRWTFRIKGTEQLDPDLCDNNTCDLLDEQKREMLEQLDPHDARFPAFALRQRRLLQRSIYDDFISDLTDSLFDSEDYHPTAYLDPFGADYTRQISDQAAPNLREVELDHLNFFSWSALTAQAFFPKLETLIIKNCASITEAFRGQTLLDLLLTYDWTSTSMRRVELHSTQDSLDAAIMLAHIINLDSPSSLPELGLCHSLALNSALENPWVTLIEISP